MEYTFTAPPAQANNGWMGHQIELYVKGDREIEFKETLTRLCEGEDSWRIQSKTNQIYFIGVGPTKVRFRHKKHAMMLKLQWEEDEDPRKNWMEKWSSTIAQLTATRSTGLQSQSVGRALIPMASVRPSGNPIPWFSYQNATDGIYPMRAKNWAESDHLGATGKLFREFYETPLEKPADPWWIPAKLEREGHDVIKMEVLKSRVAASPSAIQLIYDVSSGKCNEPGSDRTSG